MWLKAITLFLYISAFHFIHLMKAPSDTNDRQYLWKAKKKQETVVSRAGNGRGMQKSTNLTSKFCNISYTHLIQVYLKVIICL